MAVLGLKLRSSITEMPIMPSLPILAVSTTFPSSVVPTTEHMRCRENRRATSARSVCKAHSRWDSEWLPRLATGGHILLPAGGRGADFPTVMLVRADMRFFLSKSHTSMSSKGRTVSFCVVGFTQGHEKFWFPGTLSKKQCASALQGEVRLCLGRKRSAVRLFDSWSRTISTRNLAYCLRQFTVGHRKRISVGVGPVGREAQYLHLP